MIGRKPVIINVTQPAHTEYVTRTVHEHRAPTDESVKLLREMEQAAQAKIDQSIRLEGNGFECVVRTERDEINDQRVAVAVFVLNGKRMRAEARVGGGMRDPAEIATALRDAVAKVLAVELLAPALSDALKNVYRGQ